MFLFSSIINDLIQKDKASSSTSSNSAADSIQALKQLISDRKAILREEIHRLEAEYRKETAELHAQQHQDGRPTAAKSATRRLSIASIASSLSSLSSSSSALSVEEAKKQHTIHEIQARIEAEMTAIKASPEYRHCHDPSARQLVQGLKYWFIWQL
ncbi:hypothetical protein DFQ26_009601 [Actinomortierella ambigua]|nr:hypothetical protein DFQ26_009601 [Actinomortierella ambigua]